MEKEATPATHGPLAAPSSFLPKPRSKRHAKCAHHPQWTAQEKKHLCCWACQALLDPNLPRRKKPCVNPWPWARDSLVPFTIPISLCFLLKLKLKHVLQGLGLTTFKGYKLNASNNDNTQKNDAVEVSLAGEQEDPATRTIPKEDDAAPDDLDLPQDNQPLVSVGLGDHEVAEKVARYLQAMATPNGGPGGGRVATIDHLLDRVKSAYVRLMESMSDNVCDSASSSGKPDLLVPLVPDSQEVPLVPMVVMD